MKILGVILVLLGVAMILIRGFSFTTEKEVIDLGPVEIDKKENNWVGWPTYAGGIVALAGVVMLMIPGKKS